MVPGPLLLNRSSRIPLLVTNWLLIWSIWDSDNCNMVMGGELVDEGKVDMGLAEEELVDMEKVDKELVDEELVDREHADKELETDFCG